MEGGDSTELRTPDKNTATMQNKKSSGFSNSKDRSQKPLTFHYTKNESSDDDSDSFNQSYFSKTEKSEEGTNDSALRRGSEQTNGSAGTGGGQSCTHSSSAPLLDDKKDDAASLEGSQNGSIASSQSQPPEQLSHSSSSSILSQAEVELEKRRNSEMVSSKYATRSEEFRKSFKGISGERLICDYSCALQREILIQGRLYITANWLCFKSKLLVWHTSLTIRFADITNLVKDKTALIIPNAISVIANDEKYFFTSFATRDKVFDLLQQVWKVTTVGQALSNDEIWQLVLQNYTTVSNPEQPVEEVKEVELKPVDKTSNADTNSSEGETSSLQGDAESQTFISGMVCQDKTSESHVHEGKSVLEETYPVSLNRLCEMIFTDSSVFADYAKTQTMTDVQIGTWNTSAQQSTNKERVVKYNIAVRVHVGVRTSFMTERQTCQLMTVGDNQSVVHVDSECQSKGVPYCDSFIVCNHYCVSSLAPKQTRLVVYSDIKYTKSVWGVAKGFIERNVHQGLLSSFSSLAKCLKKECAKLSHQPSAEGADDGDDKSSTLPADAAVSADDEVVTVAKVIPREMGAESGVWLRMQTLCFVLLVLLLSSHVIMFYRLLALESSALVPQHCPAQEFCGGVNAAPIMTVSEWTALIEKQQQQHELEMETWKSLLERSLRMADDMRQTYAALHAGHLPSSQPEHNDLSSSANVKR